MYLVLLIAVFSWTGGLFTQSQDQVPYSEVLGLFQNQQGSRIQDQFILQVRTRYLHPDR